MSNTPETDKRVIQMLSPLQSGTMDVVVASFARELEADRNVWRTKFFELALDGKEPKGPSSL